jgi:uncharacterized lipoprotein YddW (UPF0748 family)
MKIMRVNLMVSSVTIYRVRILIFAILMIVLLVLSSCSVSQPTLNPLSTLQVKSTGSSPTGEGTSSPNNFENTVEVNPIITPVKVDHPKINNIMGVWVQAESISTKEKIDEMLQKTESMGLNAVFVNVFLYGQSMYDSQLVQKYEIVAEDFNPLPYIISEAHKKGIQVHAWLVAGAIGTRGATPLTEHPDWALVGPLQQTTGWLNFSKPEVRQFVSDLTLELIDLYPVDGVHFDYTRYPGPEWSFDPYSIEKMKEEYGIDLEILRYGDLPAYGFFKGNPLSLPGSAKVLASFSNGVPAVTINSVGDGEAILLNWDANRQRIALESRILDRSIQYLKGDQGQVYLLSSETNAEEYGLGSFDRAKDWLNEIGWSPIETTDAEIDSLDPDSVLVLPNIYLISTTTAQKMLRFVESGGGLIFIDGPTRSILNGDVRAITGMNFRGQYFDEELLITANAEHPILPTSMRSDDIRIYQEMDLAWREFRMQGINQLIQDIYSAVHRVSPSTIISVTVTSDINRAKYEIFQDWPAWMNGRYIDLLIPRFYVDEVSELRNLFSQWKQFLEGDRRISAGLITYHENTEVTKDPQQLLVEMKMAEEAGSNGIMLFDLDHMNEEQQTAVSQFINTGTED